MARLMRDRKRDTHGSAKIHTLYTRNHTSQGRRGTLKPPQSWPLLRSCSVRPLAPIAGAPPHGSNLAHRLRLQLLVRLLGVGPHGVLRGLIEIVRRVLRGAEPSASASGELLADQGGCFAASFEAAAAIRCGRGMFVVAEGNAGAVYQWWTDSQTLPSHYFDATRGCGFAGAVEHECVDRRGDATRAFYHHVAFVINVPHALSPGVTRTSLASSPVGCAPLPLSRAHSLRPIRDRQHRPHAHDLLRNREDPHPHRKRRLVRSRLDNVRRDAALHPRLEDEARVRGDEMLRPALKVCPAGTARLIASPKSCWPIGYPPIRSASYDESAGDS